MERRECGHKFAQIIFPQTARPDFYHRGILKIYIFNIIIIKSVNVCLCPLKLNSRINFFPSYIMILLKLRKLKIVLTNV